MTPNYTPELPTDKYLGYASFSSDVFDFTVDQISDFCGYELEMVSWTGDGEDENGAPDTFYKPDNTISVTLKPGTLNEYEIQFFSGR